MSGLFALAQLYERDMRISPVLFTSLRTTISLQGKASRSLLWSVKRTCRGRLKKIDTLMLSLEAQKQKSPQTVDVIEELLWTERTKRKEFYLDVKTSLLTY